MKNTFIEKQTGQLFGGLFSAYDQENYIKSVEIFKQRFIDNGFDINFFKNKKCLDLGCGGGRYSIALSMLGADEVYGVDISKEGIEDAKKRASIMGIKNVIFEQNTAERLPFQDGNFDCVIFSGVLMHMENPEIGLSEVSRVLRKRGMVYLLVYATEGIRWPLINILRNFSNEIGFENFDIALAKNSDLDINKRRTYLDDLFVPVIDFYSEDRLIKLLQKNGFDEINRWEKGRLDHEEDLQSYYQDLKKLTELFEAGKGMKNEYPTKVSDLFESGAAICNSCLNYVSKVMELLKKDEIDHLTATKIIIGQGHHRVTAIKQ